MPQPTSASMSTGLKVLLAAAAVAQVAGVGAAHADISRRQESELRGSKLMWRALTLTSVVGPPWYFLRGKRRA